MIRATVSFVKAKFDANYINASAQDFRVRARSFDNPFYVETITLSEVIGIAYAKNESEILAIADVNIYHMTKPIPDSVTVGDNAVVEASYLRSISSALTLNDVVNNITKGNTEVDQTTLTEIIVSDYTTTEGEILPITELLSHLIAKIEADDFSMASNQVIQSSKTETDGFSYSDSNIFDFDKSETDILNFASTQVFDHSKVLGSGFNLSSLLQVGNEFAEDDTDLLSFSDTIVISRVHGRALGNMVLGSTTFN